MTIRVNLPQVISLSVLLILMSNYEHSTGIRAQTQDTNQVITGNKPGENEVIYVNPNSGNDQNGKGSQESPFKTITQALMLANPQTTIILSPGTYSKETGENFPLILNTEVTIEGHRRSQGHNVIIEGNGSFISPTAAGQNVTIVASEKAGKLAGVTVINPHPRGYGLWIESASPEITDNTFTRNGSSGVSINGDSAPIIARNRFYHNRGNGLIIYGTSRPQIQNNTFEKTGFAISIMENANPRLDNNQIIGNRLGVILEGNAQATLRNNVIEQSTEHGLVAIAESRVDLGTNSDPGANLFRSNRGLDIRNLTDHSISAVGTQLSGNFEGHLDFGNSLVINTVAETATPASNSTSISVPLAETATPATDSISIPVPLPETATPATRNYRVIVAATEQQETKVKNLYPDAFTTVYYGQKMLQIGLFSSWENAQQLLVELTNLGLDQILIIRD